MFRALRYHNFRLFFVGQTVSLVGTWMQVVAVSWLAYRMTNSPFLLGCVAFSSQVPSLFLAPVAGVVADRYDRRRLLILVQVLCMVQAVVLAALVITRTITVAHIFMLSVFIGVLNAFEVTVRQSFIVELVDNKADLANAIALNSMMFNFSRLIGPTTAGVLIATLGEGACFTVNAVSYAAVVAALWFIRIPVVKAVRSRQAMNIGKEFREGLSYAFDFLPIRLLLIMVTLFSAVGSSLSTLLPVFVRDIFHGGPKMFGFLMAVSGAGALMGTVYMARKRSVAGLAEMMGLSAAVMGFGLAAFAMSTVYWVACIAAFFIGLTMMVGIGGGNIFLQTLVHDDKRGRVMSLYALALMGIAPFGSLGAGAFAAKFGADGALMIGSVISFAGAFFFWRKLERFHLKAGPVYLEKGIFPEV